MKEEEHLILLPFSLDCLVVCLGVLRPCLGVPISIEAPFSIWKPLRSDSKSKDGIWKGNATPGKDVEQNKKCCAMMDIRMGIKVQDTSLNKKDEL